MVYLFLWEKILTYVSTKGQEQQKMTSHKTPRAFCTLQPKLEGLTNRDPLQTPPDIYPLLSRPTFHLGTFRISLNAHSRKEHGELYCLSGPICANIWAVLAGRENTQKRWQELNSVATKLTRLPLNFFSEKWIVKISNKSSTNWCEHGESSVLDNLHQQQTHSPKLIAVCF